VDRRLGRAVPRADRRERQRLACRENNRCRLDFDEDLLPRVDADEIVRRAGVRPEVLRVIHHRHRFDLQQ
jgi:hypothetical protein